MECGGEMVDESLLGNLCFLLVWLCPLLRKRVMRAIEGKKHRRSTC